MKWVLKLLAFVAVLFGLVFAAAGCVGMPHGKMAEAARLSRAKAKTRVIEGVSTASVVGDHPVTIFFVHGTPGEAANWGYFTTNEELGKRANLVAIDRVGFGGTRPGQIEPRFSGQIEALKTVAREYPGRKIWVGHSYGVSVLGALVEDSPELIDGMVLVAGSTDPELSQPRWYHRLTATWLGQAVVPQSLKDANVEMMTLGRELAKVAGAWAKVDFPVTVVHAENDVLADFGTVAFLKGRVPGEFLRTVELEKGNHFLIWTHVELIRGELLRMMGR